MKRLVPNGLLIALAALTAAGCLIEGGSKPESKTESESDEKRPTQLSMITAANEIAARARLLSISTAEAAYQAENDGFATLDQLIEIGFVNDPSEGKLGRYRFEVKVKPSGFEATAVPEKYGVSGNRSFYVDETGVIRGADKGGAKADASDPPV